MIPIQHIHPILVHFPIVFVLTLAGLDLLATLRGQPVTGRSGWGNASTALAVLAGLFAIAAFFFGDIALEFAESSGFHNDLAEIHEHLGESTAIALAVWGALRALLWLRNISISGAVKIVIPLVELGGVAAVLATAYYGGQLVYGLGVNVAHM
ncbi:hypothetical protein JCM17960_16480 [Magnetospira thiophila]